MRIWANSISMLYQGVQSLNRFLTVLGLALILNLGAFCPQAFAVELAPQILSTMPQSNAVGVKTSSVISVTFDKDMDASSFKGSSFIIQRAGKENISSSSITYDELSRTAVFIPYLQLQTDTLYKVKLMTEIKDKSGVTLASNYEYSFTTTKLAEPPSISSAPKITYTAPVTDELNVGLKQSITVHFDSAMDGSTINSATFWVAPDVSGDPVKLPGDFQLATDKRSFTFTLSPNAKLNENERYKVSLSKGIKKETGGEPLAEDYFWTFTTGKSDYSKHHGFYEENPNSCNMCHQAHTASGKSLLTQSAQTDVCYTCHDGSGSSINIRTAMTDPELNSSHPIMNSGNTSITGTLECSTCHNPHGDKDPQGVYIPDLLRVADLTQPFNSVDNCISCHKAGSKYDKSAYKVNSYHYTIGKVSCNQCHSPHGSPYFSLQSRQKDSILLSESGTKQLVIGECFECHAKDNLPNNPVNVGRDFLKASSHNPEKCTTCHEPHSSSSNSVQSSCITCHDKALDQSTISGFSDVDKNLHFQHSTESCISCHQPHGSDYRNSVTLNSQFSTRVITAFNTTDNQMANPKSWTYGSCTTNCHTIPQQSIVIPNASLNAPAETPGTSNSGTVVENPPTTTEPISGGTGTETTPTTTQPPITDTSASQATTTDSTTTQTPTTNTSTTTHTTTETTTSQSSTSTETPVAPSPDPSAQSTDP